MRTKYHHLARKSNIIVLSQARAYGELPHATTAGLDKTNQSKAIFHGHRWSNRMD